MDCPACQHGNAEDARFCVQCGTRLERSCQACGAGALATHKFCQQCGAALPWARPPAQATPPAPQPEGERRQVTVLFGDLTGFTALTQQSDSESTHELLNRYFDAVDGVIRHYGGTVDKHIGDAVMAVFGAPTAHSNDPERALRSAIDIHAALAAFTPPLKAHIGIASGTVVASPTGSDAHREYTVTGDSVNLAARLQDLAGPGETWLSDAVHDTLAGLFAFEDLGPVPIKGLSEPVKAWRLGSTSQARARVERLPFVARRAELTQFEGMLHNCLSNNDGQALLIRGEPGIGKSRLLDEFRLRAQARGFAWHTALVLDFGTGKGSDAIATVLRGLLGVADDASQAQQLAAVADLLASQMPTEQQQAFALDLLSLPQPAALRSIYDAMNSAMRDSGKQDLLRALLASRAAQHPTAIVIEDVHWADRGTLALLAGMASACASRPALLIMTSRIDGDPIDRAWRASLQGAALATMDLGPLRSDDALRLANSCYSASDDYAKTCIDRAGGNPLFLEQLLRSAENFSSTDLPGSVQSVVLARMDRLDAKDRLALQAASVVGQRFSEDLVRFLINQSDYDCAALVQHALIRPEGSGLLFSHALVRDGVYASLLKKRRFQLHLRAAEWFEARDPGLRAQHLGLAQDPRAPQAFLDAAKEEARAYHNDAAIDLCGSGLEGADAHTHHNILCLQAELLRGLGQIGRSMQLCEQAVALAGDDAQARRAWIGMAQGLRVSDRPDEALAALDQAQQKTRQDQPLVLAEIHHLRGNLYFPMGRHQDCLAQHQLALDYARQAGSREWEAQAMGGLGDAFYLSGRMRTACDYFVRCVSLSRELGLRRIEVANSHMVGWTRMFLNEYEQAYHDGIAAIEASEQVGQTRSAMLGRWVVCLVCLEQNRLHGLEAQMQLGFELAERLKANNFKAQGLAWMARIRRAQGHLDEARTYIRQALQTAREAGLSFFGPMILANAARLSEDERERTAFFAEGEALLSQGCVSHNYFWFYRDGAEALLESGQWDEAERFAAALQAYASAEPLPWSDLFAARIQALSRFGRGERTAALGQDIARLCTAVEQSGALAYLPSLQEAAQALAS